MKRTTPTTKSTNARKAKTATTPPDATGAKPDALQGSPMIERKLKIHSGGKIHRFDICGINETELQNAREHDWKLVKDQEQKNRNYMEGNVKKFGTACPSRHTCIFPPFPLVYEGPNEPKRTAWIVKAQADMKDWFDSPSPSRIISFVAVLGRAEAIKINLFLHDENLTRETIHLSPMDIKEITYKRWEGITFKTGFQLDLIYCKSERLSMQEIKDDTFIQQAIEEHFSNTPKQEPKAPDELSAWARSQGVSEYVHGDHVTWGGEVWRFTSPKQWELVRLALTSESKEGGFEEPKAKDIEHTFGGEYRNKNNSPQYAFLKHIHKTRRGGKVYQFRKESK